MAKLLVLQGNQHRVFEMQDPLITVGRAPDNVLWLDDPSLSRRHCEIRQRGNDWYLHDNGSFNGTFLNNLACQEQRLRPGDRIQIGTTVCYYVPDEDNLTPVDKTDTVTLRKEDHERIAEEQKEREATSRKLRNFMSLMEITKAVNSELSRSRLLTMVVQKSIELVDAQRGFLILLEEGELRFEVALQADGAAVTDPEKQISTSVLDTVTRSGEPVITINAQNDLGAFMSIVALEVRSLICVPLKAKEKTLGALYVDSHVSAREFTAESLNLLQAFADQAAIALQNANLYDAVLESREQEKRIRTIFQRYVPEDVVSQVLELTEGARLSNKLNVTVLFSDIRSFTAISEGLTPEEVVTFLNDYLQRMVDIVFDEGGIVDKFVGDAVMAVFGAPVTKPDDAVRAVRAALRMLDEVERFNYDQRQKGGVEIEIGVGLHTGPAIAGNMGSDKKMEYTVIGDTVNVASRVESLNKTLKTHLLITTDTYLAAGKGLEVRAMPPVPVKGKSEMLNVYEVLKSSPLLTEFQRTAGQAAPLSADELDVGDVGEMTIASFDPGSGATTRPVPSGRQPAQPGAPAPSAPSSATEAAEEEFTFDIEF